MSSWCSFRYLLRCSFSGIFLLFITGIQALGSSPVHARSRVAKAAGPIKAARSAGAARATGPTKAAEPVVALATCRVDAPAKKGGVERLKLVELNKQWKIELIRAKAANEIYWVVNPRREIESGRWESLIATKSRDQKTGGVVSQALLLNMSRASQKGHLAYRETVYPLACEFTPALTALAAPGMVIGDTRFGAALESPAAESANDPTEQTPFTPGYCIGTMKAGEAETIEECQKLRHQVPREERCFGDRAMAEIEAVIAVCYGKVAEKEHHRRLAVVKLSDKVQYQSEVQQQKDFIAMRDEICGAYKKCQGTWTASAFSNCQVQLNGFRFRMAQAINKMGLQLKDKSVDPKYWPQNALNFADSVCQLPSRLWQGEKAPENCQARVLGEIASFNGVPLPGTDPCGE